MSDQKSIPILNKKSGVTTYSTPRQGQVPPNGGVDGEPRMDAHQPLQDIQQSPDSSDKPWAGQTKKRQRTPSPKVESPQENPSGGTRSKIESLEQFIAYAYSRRGQRVTLTPPVERLLRQQQPKLEPEARERLLQIAEADPLLAVPRQLLLAIRDIQGHPLLKNIVREFVGEVLVGHPIFSTPELAAAIKNLPGAPEPETALAIVANSDLVTLTRLIRDKSPSSKMLTELRSNGTYCLAVWFVETRGLGLDRLSQLLLTSLWQPAADLSKSETTRLRVLTEIEDHDGVGLVAAIFKQQASEQALAAVAARKAQEIQQGQMQSLQEHNRRLQDDVQACETKIAELEQALAQGRQDLEHTRIHLGDDYEKLRTRLLRRLKTEVNLLSEGLHALRREPPKINVMDDHAERALDGLKKEIRELDKEK